MKGELKKRLQGIFVLSSMACILFAIAYGTYRGPWDPTLRRFSEQSAKEYKEMTATSPDPVQDGRMTMKVGEARTFGKIKLVYHGIQKGRIHIALTILALDPEVAYHYRVAIKEAKESFRLGGAGYRLVSYGKSDIELTPVQPE